MNDGPSDDDRRRTACVVEMLELISPRRGRTAPEAFADMLAKLKSYDDAGRASLQRELEEAKAAAMSPTHFERIPESDDGDTRCDTCGEATEEPHSFAVCAENLASDNAALWGVYGQVEEELWETRADRDAALAKLREAETALSWVNGLEAGFGVTDGAVTVEQFLESVRRAKGE